MKTYEQAGGVFWLLVAAYVLAESLRMGVGTARVPGMGFMSFYGAAILGLLSLAQFLTTFFRPAGDEDEHPFQIVALRRVVPAFAALIAYALILPSTGYVISTFALMLFLFWLAQPTRKWSVLIAAFLTTLVSYLIFQGLLDSQFPKGPFGF